MTTVMSFANQLKTVYPHLTKTEKKCAKYIHEHLETINNHTPPYVHIPPHSFFIKRATKKATSLEVAVTYHSN